MGDCARQVSFVLWDWALVSLFVRRGRNPQAAALQFTYFSGPLLVVGVAGIAHPIRRIVGNRQINQRKNPPKRVVFSVHGHPNILSAALRAMADRP